MEWVSLAVSVVVAMLTGGAMVAIVNAFAGRRKVNADASGRLSDSALKWVEQFQEETLAARHEAASARIEVESMRHEVAAARREVQQVRTEAERALRSIRLMIMSPHVTIEQLREHISGPDWLSDMNGQPR